MRKLLVLCLTLALVFTTLVLPSRSSASPEGKGVKSAVPATRKIGQDPAANANPLMYRAVNFGESRPVSELAAAQPTVSLKDMKRVNVKDHEEVIEQKLARNLAGKKGSKDGGKEALRGEDGVIEKEKNRRNAERIRTPDPNAKATADGALARVPGGKGSELAPQVLPTPTVNFESVSLTDTTALPGQGFLPPDINGEVGPNHFVETVNVAFRIYDKTGAPLIPLTSIGTLFGAIPGPCANNEDGDPIVMYDQMADRWLISEFCTVANPNNHQLIAISKTGDPTGAYYLYDFMMPNNDFNDYPHFGVWSDGYYMTDNEFNQAGTQFLGAGLFAFDRAKMIAGDPTASYIYFDKNTGCPAACQFGGMLPADIDGFTPPPAGAPNTFMQFDDDQTGGAADQLRIFDFHADFATPANSTLTERTGSPLAVAAFDSREVPAGSRNVVPQPAGSALDVISDRLMFRLAYRNFGDHESLALNYSVNAATNPTFRAGVRYYEIRRTNPAAAWTVQEQATMAGAAGDTEHRWMGSTALNGSGSQAVAYSVSSTTVFPSIRYAGRLSGDPAGSLAQGEQTLVNGTSAQTSTSGRWGDYTDLTVDPTDDCTFWYAGEYVTGATAPDNTRWHTRVGAFKFGTCAPVQKGILTGTITSSAGGAPIPNATVQAGPFIRSSNATGVYNIDPMGTGTYSMTVSAPGYTTATVPGVIVSQGGTTMQNVQLTPQNVLAGGTPVITAESCVPANLALDPGETVTVNLPIVNTGGAGATTSNLVATLQATGGVSSPSGPQTYGAVAQGSPAVVKSFTFTVSATCGQIANVTLHLVDGATDYGNVVYNMQTGTLGAASPLSVSTGNIATAIPDVSSVDVPIVVSQTGAVADLNVKVRLNHTFDGDVTIALVAPDNTIVTLSDRRANANDGGDNYGTGNNDCSGTPTIFDDAAANSISTGAPPFAGTFKPETPLSAFNGKSITGTWKLRVTDSAALDTGTIGCVTLDFMKQPFICCGVSGTPVIGSGGAATITGESVSPANNAPDPGETVTATFPLINTGDGNTTNLVATMQASGGVTPVGPPTVYGVVTAGGPAVSQPISFVASGTCGTNITATLHLTDGAVDLGNVAYTFRLGTTSTSSQTFTNATAIVIPATGTGVSTGAPANPYPSAITVAGVTNPITKVTVTLKQISHTFPSDVDVLLVGPTGRKFIVMSDVIGGTDWTGQTYTLDDDAAALLPSSGTPPASGSFKPTNYTTGDAFPAPAPAAPYLTPATAGTDTFASAFAGLDPNGTWSLYVVDDAGTDIGQFAGGWDLTLTSTQSVCNAQTCGIICPANINVPADGGGVSAVVNYPSATPTGACGALGYSTPSGSTFPVGITQVTVTGANAATCQFNVTVTPPAGAQNLIISEFRLRGPSGANDEYVELYNNSDSPLTISTSDGSAGWALAASSGGTRFTVPNGTVIPARGHYLGVNSVAYSLASYPAGNGTTATGDATYTTDIPDNAGIALFNTANPANFTLLNRLDAVGSVAEANVLYKEGTGYPAVNPAFSIESGFYRNMNPSGLPVDTNNNATDFLFVDNNGTSAGAGQRLGAPGPENLSSPIQRNATVKASLIDPTVSSSLPPNRVRDFTPGSGSTSTFGTLELRRKFTNTTGASVTRLRFRIVDITTFPSPAGTADLRPITSPDVVVSTSGGPVTVRGTTLETPPSQPNGGGFNSSMSAGTITLGTPLANGASINMRFVLGVQQAGAFRFFVNVEALP
ncbi:MAG: proprotein convertase P-domain-containing protein [Pyrinomonadaceae bacterium]